MRGHELRSWEDIARPDIPMVGDSSVPATAILTLWREPHGWVGMTTSPIFSGEMPEFEKIRCTFSIFVESRRPTGWLNKVHELHWPAE
jgi:hypothetical protein